MVVMANPAIQAVERSVLNKAHLRAVRRSGKVPAVVYGRDKATAHVTVDEKELRRLLDKGSEARLIDLVLNNKRIAVLIKEVQRQVVSDQILHVDFNAVDLTHEIEVVVPISLVGEHTKDIPNRVIVYNLREVEVRCLPTNLPDSIELDVTTLQIGESVKAGELVLPAGVSLVTAPDTVVVSAVVAKVAEEEPGAEEITEPEVIKVKAVDEKDEDE